MQYTYANCSKNDDASRIITEPFYPIDSIDTNTYSFKELITYIIAPIAIHMFWSKVAYVKK